MDSAERKASKEATQPPSFIECLVKSEQCLSFSLSLTLVITSIVIFLPISEIHPSVGGTERRASSFVVESVSGFRLSESHGEIESGNDDCAVCAACAPQIMSSAVNAHLKILSDTTIFLSETRSRMSSIPWAITRASIVQRAALGDEECRTTVCSIHLKSTDIIRRITAPVGGQCGSHFILRLRPLQPIEDSVSWVIYRACGEERLSDHRHRRDLETFATITKAMAWMIIHQLCITCKAKSTMWCSMKSTTCLVVLRCKSADRQQNHSVDVDRCHHILHPS